MTKTTTKQFFATHLSIAIGLAVLLCGAHAKDVTGLSVAARQNAKKFVSDDTASLVKTSPDLHNHIDKQSLKTLVKAIDTSAMQADSRSLRALRESKDDNHRASISWLTDWFQLARVYIGLF